ncbi:glycosyltransferase family 2 protein, partial [Salmonella enterica]|nr:glycosyltransferase family 2 protein [Salmonella enterica]
MKTVSVVIPCFNSIGTIDQALNSVYKQTYNILEIICIDDCSIDNTYEYIKNNHPTVKLFKNKNNMGPAASRNIGASYCSGEFIAFLDADDTWFSDKTKLQMALIERYGLDFIGSSFVVAKSETETNTSTCRIITTRELAFKNYFPTPSVILRKDLVRFDESMGFAEDYDLWLRLSIANCVMGFIDQPLVALGKPSFGYSGLSSNLFRMQCGELKSLSNSLKKDLVYYFA